MIKNERQYRITKSEIKRFSNALQDENAKPKSDVDPIIFEAAQSAMREQLRELQEQIREYESLKDGSIQFIHSYHLNDLPITLIKARISSGLSQKELGDKLGLKEQQIQRYEENEYASASLSKLQEIASALNISISIDSYLNIDDRKLSAIYKKLDSAGISKNFLHQRLSRYSEVETLPSSARVASFMPALESIYKISLNDLIVSDQLKIDSTPIQSARFKVRKGQNEKRLNAYSVYAHYVASIVQQNIPSISSNTLPNTAESFYDDVVCEYGELNFENTLRYIWSLGIAILPLNDRASFDGAYWREDYKHVIVLSQRVSSTTYWLFDLLHDYFHSTQHPDLSDSAIIEDPPTSEFRRESEDEVEASEFANEVILAGQTELLWNTLYKRTNGNIKFIKRILPDVADSVGVSLPAAANYVAYKLHLDGQNWWATAQSFKSEDDNPADICRDIFLENFDFTNLSPTDRDLIYTALTDEVC